eukprot:scaffold421294_cov56-Attheya_sp.AAC.2
MKNLPLSSERFHFRHPLNECHVDGACFVLSTVDYQKFSLTPPMITSMKRSHPTLHGAPSSVQSNKRQSQASMLVTRSPSSAQTNTF